MSSVAHIWGRILAWAVPPGLAEADPDTARRARLVTAMLLIIAPPASFIGLVHAIRGSALQAVALLVVMLRCLSRVSRVLKEFGLTAA